MKVRATFSPSVRVSSYSLFASSPAVYATIIGTATDDFDGTFTYSYTIDNSTEPVFEVTSWFLDVSSITPD